MLVKLFRIIAEDEEIVSVETYLDDTEVADIMRKYDLESVPVVNVQGQLVGRTAVQLEAASAEPLSLVARVDVFRLRAPYYAEHVRREIAGRLGEAAMLQDGLQIETPAQLELGTMAHDAIDGALRKMDLRQGWRGPVAHLAEETGRATFRERAAAEYGADPLTADPLRWRLALVTEVDAKKARVAIGGVEALLPLKKMNWAARYDRNATLNDATLAKVSEADRGRRRSCGCARPRSAAPRTLHFKNYSELNARLLKLLRKEYHLK